MEKEMFAITHRTTALPAPSWKIPIPKCNAISLRTPPLEDLSNFFAFVSEHPTQVTSPFDGDFQRILKLGWFGYLRLLRHYEL